MYGHMDRGLHVIVCILRSKLDGLCLNAYCQDACTFGMSCQWFLAKSNPGRACVLFLAFDIAEAIHTLDKRQSLMYVIRTATVSPHTQLHV